MSSSEYDPNIKLDPALDFELVMSWASDRLLDAIEKQDGSTDKLYFDVAEDRELKEYFANFVLGEQSKRAYRGEMIEIGLPVASGDVNQPQPSMTGPDVHFKVAWPTSAVEAERKLHLVDRAVYAAELAKPDKLSDLPNLLGKLMSYHLVAIF